MREGDTQSLKMMWMAMLKVWFLYIYFFDAGHNSMDLSNYFGCECVLTCIYEYVHSQSSRTYFNSNTFSYNNRLFGISNSTIYDR